MAAGYFALAYGVGRATPKERAVPVKIVLTRKHHQYGLEIRQRPTGSDLYLGLVDTTISRLAGARKTNQDSLCLVVTVV